MKVRWNFLKSFCQLWKQTTGVWWEAKEGGRLFEAVASFSTYNSVNSGACAAEIRPRWRMIGPECWTGLRTGRGRSRRLSGSPVPRADLGLSRRQIAVLKETTGPSLFHLQTTWPINEFFGGKIALHFGCNCRSVQCGSWRADGRPTGHRGYANCPPGIFGGMVRQVQIQLPRHSDGFKTAKKEGDQHQKVVLPEMMTAPTCAPPPPFHTKIS